MNPIIERVFEAVIRIDESLKIVFISESGISWLGGADATAPPIGQPFLNLVHPDEHKPLLEALSAAPSVFSVYARLMTNPKPTWVCLRATRTPIINHYLICVLDVSELKRKDTELVYAAKHDSLTGLPNRSKLTEVVARHIESRSTEFKVALLDLDEFKKVNDTLGHLAGDYVLVETAKRLTDCIDTNVDLVARLGGDEFVMVLNGSDNDRIAKVLNRVLCVLTRPFYTEPHPAYIGCSIGVAKFPLDGSDYSTLLKNADSAMYVSKRNGKNKITAYIEADESSDLGIKAALHKGIANGEFLMAYQPIVTSTGTLVGAEALIRWDSKESFSLSIRDIIRVAEDIGVIQYLGEWALRYACAQLAKFQLVNPKFWISVNVSVKQLATREFLDTARSIVSKSGINPKYLTLEIPEASVLVAELQGKEYLEELSTFGMCLSVDDFGTGMSSLVQLTSLPIDSLKIDKSFVQATTCSVSKDADASRRLVKAIVNLAQSLKVTSIAKGVETPDQFQYLKDIGCDLFQGYLIGKPVYAKDLLDMLEKGTKDEK